jgi:hypothetical protein
LIGFVYEDGALPGADGSTVRVDTTTVDQSANAELLSNGFAYPAFYGTLPATLRDHLAKKSQAARDSGRGLWPRSTADPNGAAKVVGMSALESLVIWPKLFRRIVSFMGAGHHTFDSFHAWLREDPVHRDDKLFRLDTNKPSTLHEVVDAAGSSIQLTVWPESLVIEPDPAP